MTRNSHVIGSPIVLPDILTVSELNRLARTTLEQRFPLLWIAGEVSNLTRAPSGHVYFTLKDADAQVRCAMFRSRAQLLAWRIENGQQVEVQALVTLYEARGDYQLNVESARRAGLGKLYEAFLCLKEKLAREGLFDEAKKRPLPRFPRTVGIVTSPRAAALRDVVAAFRRRAPSVELIVYPTLVQGEGAAAQIAAAIETAGSRAECDVLLVVRGGGSLEDLWAFNEEAVARALAACPVPVVCGVGHETDTTIADLAADRRAATPTAAAELASAGWFDAAAEAAALREALRAALRRRIEARMQRLDILAHRLVHPAQRLTQLGQRIAHLATRLSTAGQRAARRHRDRLASMERRLMSARPRPERYRARLERLSGALAALSPQATLDRGYSIVRNAQGEVIRSGRQLAVDAPLSLRFAEGGGEAIVIRKFPD